MARPTPLTSSSRSRSDRALAPPAPARLDHDAIGRTWPHLMEVSSPGDRVEPGFGRPSSALRESHLRRVSVLLAMAMFVLVVDTSLMNVSIAAVVRDLDTTVTRGPGLGRVHPDRQQGRRS